MVPPRNTPACRASRPNQPTIARVENHRERGQRGDAGNGEDELALGLLVAGKHRGDRDRGRGAADGGGTAREDAEAASLSEQGRDPHAEGDGRRHGADHEKRRAPAERADLLERDASPEQGHAEPQHAARREVDARLGAALGGDRIERHADQERVQKRRAAPLLGDERRGNRNDDGEDEPGPRLLQLSAPLRRRGAAVFIARELFHERLGLWPRPVARPRD